MPANVDLLRELLARLPADPVSAELLESLLSGREPGVALSQSIQIALRQDEDIDQTDG